MKGLLCLVCSAVINRDPNFASLSSVDSSFLQFFESEAFSSANLHVVLESLGMNRGSQEARDGSGEDLGGLLDSGQAPGPLLGGLVEPSVDETLPILMEVGVGDNVVVLHHIEGGMLCLGWR